MKNILDLIKSKSIFKKWFLSYVSILFIPIILSNIVFFMSEKLLTTEVNNANKALLTQTQQSIDARLRDIRGITLQMALSPNIQPLLNASVPLKNYENYAVVNINKELRNYQLGNGFIDDLFIYFISIETAISSSGSISSELLYKYIHQYKGISYEDWLEGMLKVSHYQKWQQINVSGFDENEQKMLMLTQSIPFQVNSETKANCVILIDERKFKALLGKNDWNDQGDVYIMNKNNECVVSLKDHSTISLDIGYNEINDKTGTFMKEINGKSMYVSYITSEVYDWKYISVIPRDIFMQKVEYIRRITICIVLLCMLLGIIVAYFMTKRNYKPLTEILSTLSDKFRSNRSHVSNELNLIKEAVKTILNEKDQLADNLDKQKPVMKMNFFNKLLKGRFNNDNNFADTMKSLDIDFISEHFGVFTIKLDEKSGFFKKRDEEGRMLAFFILSNVINELVDSRHRGYVFEIDDVFACLVNFKPGTSQENAKKDLLDIADTAFKFIRENFDLFLWVGISTIKQGTSVIYEGYYEAQRSVEYISMVNNAGNIYCYDDKMDMHFKYRYSMETEQQLINAVKAGDYATVTILIDRVLKQTFDKRIISMQIARCLFFDIISTVIKTLEEINSLNEELFLGNNGYIDQLTQCKTIEEMCNKTLYIFKQVCEDINLKKTDRNEELRRSIIEFLEQEYSDVNLSVDTIAIRFNMNGTYLSRVFKEKTGDSLIDYLNKVRVKNSKGLLVSTEKGLNEILNSVGFVNVSTFIRTFKKYEGITPGQFRQINEK